MTQTKSSIVAATSRAFKHRPLCAAVSLCIAFQVQANPENPQLIDGDADFSETENTFTVDQHSDRILVNYDEFSIAENESVIFVQPGTESIAVNRVTGSNVSEIFGSLEANGQVFLINTNGVMFSESARVNVSALGASTLSFDQDDFGDGTLHFEPNTDGGFILNAGDISALGENAYVAFISPNIDNTGSIFVPEGSVDLHAANSAVITLAGEGIGIEATLAGEAGNIANSGDIEAGQQVVLTAKSVDNLYDTLIDNSGTIEATGFAMVNGRIQLVATGGDVINEGTLDASGNETSGNAGDIDIDAERIAQMGSVRADAFGDGDGGTISVHSDELLVVTEGAETSANADQSGNGGDIVFYSEDTAYFDPDASITATGGNVSGDGGFVEFSGIKHVSARGFVDTRAFNNSGETGTYLIDPVDITITNSASSDGSFNVGAGPFSWTPSADSSNILSSEITTNLTTNNVEINTNQAGAGTGDLTIEVDIDINGAGSNSLTLTANNDIIFNAGTRIYDSATGSTETGTVTLNATGGSSEITMAADATINTSGGKFVAISNGTLTLTGITSLNTAFDAISINGANGLVDAGTTNTDFTTPGGIIIDAGAGSNVDFETDIGQFYTNFNVPGSTLTINEADDIFIGALNSSTGNINITTTSDITVSDNATAGIIAVGDLTLNTSASIDSNSGAGNDPILTAANLTINADTLLTDTEFYVSVGTNLSLTTDGANVYVEEADTLTLTELDVGTHSFTYANLAANTFTITDTSIVAGDFIATRRPISLTEIGQIVIPAAGLNTSGNIDLRANDFSDTVDANMVINSSLANASLALHASAPAGNITLNTNANIDSFDLGLGSGETDSIILNPAATGITITDIDIDAGTLDATLAAGDISITGFTNINDLDLTVSNGDLILPDGGITVGGNLTVNAEDLVDSNREVFFNVTGAADITLSALAGDSIFDTSITTFTNISTSGANLSIIENGDFNLNNNVDVDNQNLTIQSTTGNITLTSIATINDLDDLSLIADTGNIDINDGIVNVNNFSATATSGTITLEDAGLNASGDINLSADDITDDSGRNLSLNSTIANSTLTFNANAPVGNITLTTDANIDTFDLSLGTGETESITLAPSSTGITISDIDIDAGGLLGTLAAGNAVISSITNLNDLVLNIAAGSLTVPDTGLDTNGNIQLIATDLIDSDRTVAINSSTGTVALTLSTLAGDLGLITDIASIGLTSDGGNVVISDTDGITLSDADVNANDLVIFANGDIDINALSDTDAFSAFATGGNIEIPDAGLINNNGNIELVANDITDTSGRDLTFSSDLANSILTYYAATPAGDVTLNTTSANIDIFDIGIGAAATDQITLTSISNGTTISDIDIAAGSFVTSHTAGDLAFNAITNLNNASLTVSNGDLIVPASGGLDTTGTLVVVAEDLVDGDRNVTVNAGATDINLTAPAGDLTLTSALSNLDLTIGNGSSITVVETNAITVDDINMSGDFTLSAATGDITLTALTAVDDLSLTATAGDIILPDAVLAPSSTLTLSADDIVNSGGTPRTVQISATNADITANAPAGDLIFTSTIDSLDLSFDNGIDLTVNDTGTLSLGSIDINGAGSNLFITSTGDMTVDQAINLDGLTSNTLSLDSGNDLIFNASIQDSTGGVDNTTDLVFVAANDLDMNGNMLNAGAGEIDYIATAGDAYLNRLISSNANSDAIEVTAGDQIVDEGSTVDIEAPNGGAVIIAANGNTGGANSYIETSISEASITNTTGGVLGIRNNIALDVTEINVTGQARIQQIGTGDLSISDSTVTVTGNAILDASASDTDIILNPAGFSVGGTLSILGNDLYDSDAGAAARVINLGATTVTTDLTNPAADTTWNTTFSNLDFTSGGSSLITIVEADGLTLNDLNTTGDLSLSTTANDLIISAVTAVDDLNLSAAAGDINTPDTGITSTSTLTLTAQDIYDSNSLLILNGTDVSVTATALTADTTLDTDIDSLILDITGANLLIDENDGFTLTTADLNGNNLTIDAAGDVTLGTLANVNALDVDTTTGDLIIPDAGISTTTTLTLDTQDLRNVSNNLTLGLNGTAVNVMADALAADTTLDTGIDSLILDITGANLAVDENDGFTLTTADLNGNNLTIDAAGDVTLGTLANINALDVDATTGDLIIPDAGLSPTTTLTLASQDLRNVSNNLTLGLNGTAVNVTAGALAADTTLDTDIDSLILDITGANLLVDENDRFTLTTADLNGNNLTIDAAGDVTLGTLTNVNALDIDTTTGDLIIPDAGISTTTTLTLVTQDLRNVSNNLTLGLNGTAVNVMADALAADTTLDTDIDSLILDITGANLAVDENDGFTLTTADLNGNNLTIDAAGDVTLGTLANINALDVDATTGDLIIPDAGLSPTTTLTLASQDLRNVSNNLTLGLNGTAVNVTAGALAADTTLDTDIDSLILDITGANLLVDENDRFTLTTADLNGNNLTIDAAGDVTLGTLTNINAIDIDTTTGDLILPDTGLSATTTITLDAQDIRDLDNTVILSGTAADITGGALAADTTFSTNIDNLTLNTDGASVNVIEFNGMTLVDANVGAHNLSLNTTNGDLLITNITTANNISAVADAGDLEIPDTGLSANGNITLSGNDVVDTSGRELDLVSSVANAILTFYADTPAADITLNTNANIDTFDLGFGAAATEQLNVSALSNGVAFSDLDFASSVFQTTVANGDATIVSATNLAELDITVSNGDLIVPTSGLSTTGNLTVDAEDIHDGDRAITLAAATADLTLSAPAAALSMNTTFNNLDLTVGNASAITVNETNAITLDDINMPGDFTLSAVTGDVSVTGITAVDDLSLTATAGDIVLPSAGFTSSATLSLSAQDIYDVDAGAAARIIQLGATDATIAVTAPAGDLTFNTTFDSLDLSLGNASAITVIETDGLTLSDANMSGDLDLRTTANNLTIDAITTVNNLNLAANAGDIILPSAGFTSSAELTLSAQDIYDADAGIAARTIQLGAAAADISVTAPADTLTINSGFDSLSLALGNANTIVVNESDAITLTDATLTGDLTLSTAADDITVTAISSVDDLSLTAAGDIILPSAGFTSTATLALNAEDFYDADAGAAARDIQLGASAATLSIHAPASDLTINSNFDSLDLTLGNASPLTINETDGLTLTDTNLTGDLTLNSAANNITITTITAADDLTLDASAGSIILPSTGLTSTATLSLTAQDIIDSDAGAAARDIIIGGTAVDINASALAGDSIFNTTVDSLDLLTDGGDITVNETNAITLTDADVGANALTLIATTGDITVAALTDTNAFTAQAAAGNIALPDAGITVAGNTTLSADDIIDTSGRDLSIASSLANSILTFYVDAPADTTIINTNANIDTIDVSLGNAATEQLTLIAASNGLSISDADIANGTLDVDLANGSVTVGAIADLNNFDVNAGNGNLVIQDAGLSVSGQLTVNADAIVDSDNATILAADTANITLNAPAAPLTLNTTVNNLSVSSADATALTVNESDGFTLTDANLAGDLVLSSTINDITITAVTAVDDLSLNAIAGDLVLPNTGLNNATNITLTAQDIYDNDAGAAARTVDITTGALTVTANALTADSVLNTNIDDLTLVSDGANISVVEANALTLIDADVGANDLSLNTTTGDLLITALTTADSISAVADDGTVQIPDAGLSANGNITLSGDDITDTSGRELDLVSSVANAILTFYADTPAADITLNTNANIDTFDLGFGAAATEQLNVSALSNGVTFSDLDFTSSVFQTTVANGDATIISATNLAGLDITVANGSLIVPDAGLNITGDLNVTAQDIIDSDRTISLGAVNADLTINNAADTLSANTAFDSLTFTGGNASAMTFVESDGLTLNDVNTIGNFDLSSTANDLTITTITAAGQLNLATDAGDIILPASGLITNNALVLSALDIYDTDAGADARILDIAASAADISITAPASALTFNTSVDSLSLTQGGVSALTVNESDGLILTDANLVGDLNLSTITGNITVSAITAVEDLTLVSIAGNIVLPNTGIASNGALTLDAMDISDNDNGLAARELSLSATDTVIIATALAANTTFNTDIATLDITSNGADVFVAEANGLTLNDTDIGAHNFSLNSTSGNLVIAALSTADDISLIANTGTIEIADAGINANGNLEFSAVDVFTPSGRTLNFESDQADSALDFYVNAPIDNIQINTNQNIASADIGLGTSATESISFTPDSNGFTFTDINIAMGTLDTDLALGNLQIDNITALNNFTAGINNGDLILSDTGLNTSGQINLNADDIYDVTDRDVIVSGSDADIVLSSPADTITLSTSLDTLDISLNNAVALSIIEQDDLVVTDVLVAGDLSIESTAGNLSVQAINDVAAPSSNVISAPTFANPPTSIILQANQGQLVLPTGSQNTAGALTLSAQDIIDADGGEQARTLNLNAQSIVFDASNALGNTTLNTNTGNFSSMIGGQASLSVNNVGDLAINSGGARPQAVSIENGNFVLSNAGSISIDDTVSAADLSADGVRAGIIDIQTIDGDIVLGTGMPGRTTTITTANTVDSDAEGINSAFSNLIGIRLRTTSSDDQTYAFTVGDGTNAFNIDAQGADVLLESIGELSLNDNSAINVYERSAGETGGRIIERWTVKNGSTIVETDRTLIALANSDIPYEDVIDEIRELEDVIADTVNDAETEAEVDSNPIAGGESSSSVSLDALLSQQLSMCQTSEEKAMKDCKKAKALKRFLGALWIDGELPKL